MEFSNFEALGLDQWFKEQNIYLDVPQTVLGLGSSLNGSNIREGDDVYFECIVR